LVGHSVSNSNSSWVFSILCIILKSNNWIMEHKGKYLGFDHIRFYVGNALQTAQWYVARFGFVPIAYKGLETGSRDIVAHVVKQNDILFEFVSPLNPSGKLGTEDLAQQLAVHGDHAKDIAFKVDNCRALFESAKARGGSLVTVVQEPKEEKDENGTVVTATICTYGNVVHTFVERSNYKGVYLPGYRAVTEQDPFATFTPSPNLSFVDHVVGNQPDNAMVPLVEWYEKTLDFHRFWSVDDKMIHTEFSSLRSIVVTDKDEKVKMPLNEPAQGKKKSQIQEFVDYYAGPGVQHIALNTPDIITAVGHMQARGVKFLKVPSTYYVSLRQKLQSSPIKVKEDMDKLEELKILIDYDDKGYLLQIFTKPVEDRPTLFYEVIQRNNHHGFGAGNFKSLFEAIERDQAERGNLTTTTPAAPAATPYGH